MLSSSLDDFTRQRVLLEDVERTVYVAGVGPAVIVIHEMPGIGPHLLRFARWVRDAGITVYVPSLFGVDGIDPIAGAGGTCSRVCVSAEFRRWRRRDQPDQQLVARFARRAQKRVARRGRRRHVLHRQLRAQHDARLVLAPVVSQPSLPFDAMGLEIAPHDRRDIDAPRSENLSVLAFGLTVTVTARPQV
jgi:hypothetical protein